LGATEEVKDFILFVKLSAHPVRTGQGTCRSRSEWAITPFEIKSGEKYLLIILDNSAKDYLKRLREDCCFQVQYFLDL
jgi:hypothetical protein